MIVVDTSVWVEFFRGKNDGLVVGLRGLLDQNRVLLPKLVFLEILNGASQKDVQKVKRVFSALPTVEVSRSTWKTTEHWIGQAKAKGERFGVVDLLIGVQSKESDALVWSLDSDFQRMAGLRLIRLWRLPT